MGGERILRVAGRSKTQWIIGGNYVSKYQSDEDPTFRLPENVGSGSGRVSFTNGGWSASAEYAYKANDPSASNGFIFKEGQALLLNASYTKGFGFVLGAKHASTTCRSEATAMPR